MVHLVLKPPTEAGAGLSFLAVLSSQDSPMPFLRQLVSSLKNLSGNLALDIVTLHGFPPFCWPCFMEQVGSSLLLKQYCIIQ